MGNLKAAQKQIADDMKFVGDLLDRLHSAPADVPSWLVIQIHASIRRALEAYHNGDLTSNHDGQINIKIEGFGDDEKKAKEVLRMVLGDALKEPEFKVGDWLVFGSDERLAKGQGTLFKVERVGGGNYHYRDRAFQKDCCRLPTPEEMFKTGALVKWVNGKHKVTSIIKSHVYNESGRILRLRLEVFPDQSLDVNHCQLIERAP